MALPRAEPVEFVADRGGVAQAEVDADLLGQRGEHPRSRRWRWAAARASNGRGRPSQLTNVPAFSVDRRDGEHDVGAVGDGAVAQLQAHHERRGVDGGQCRRRVGQVVEFDAADQQGAAANRRRPHARMPDVSRPASAGRSSTCHAAATSARAAGSVDRPAAGQKIGCRTGFQRAAVAGASRHPADPCAGRIGQSERRGVGAGRAGEALADQDDRPRRQFVVQARRARPPRRRARWRSACRPSSSARGWRTARSTVTFRPRLRKALRSRRKTIGDSSSGSKPASSDRGRGLEVGVGHRHRPARDRGGEELRLLVGVRAAAEVDVVGAQHDPGELGVGVGVLERRPAADQHAGARRPPRSGRGRRPRRPPTTTPGAGCRRRRAPAGWRSGRPGVA